MPQNHSSSLGAEKAMSISGQAGDLIGSRAVDQNEAERWPMIASLASDFVWGCVSCALSRRVINQRRSHRPLYSSQ